MKCRESPLAKTPPANMANIPGITSPGDTEVPKENGMASTAKSQKRKCNNILI